MEGKGPTLENYFEDSNFRHIFQKFRPVFFQINFNH